MRLNHLTAVGRCDLWRAERRRGSGSPGCSWAGPGERRADARACSSRYTGNVHFATTSCRPIPGPAIRAGNPADGKWAAFDYKQYGWSLAADSGSWAKERFLRRHGMGELLPVGDQLGDGADRRARGDFSQLLGPNPFYSTPQVIRDPLTGLPFPGQHHPGRPSLEERRGPDEPVRRRRRNQPVEILRQPDSVERKPAGSAKDNLRFAFASTRATRLSSVTRDTAGRRLTRSAGCSLRVYGLDRPEPRTSRGRPCSRGVPGQRNDLRLLD